MKRSFKDFKCFSMSSLFSSFLSTFFFFFFVSSPSSLKICLPNYFIYNLRQSIIRLLDRPERIDAQTIPDHARSSINPLNNRGYEYSWVRIPFCVTRLRFLLVNEPSKRRIDRRGASPSPSFPSPSLSFSPTTLCTRVSCIGRVKG